jgi:hypothetical protein
MTADDADLRTALAGLGVLLAAADRRRLTRAERVELAALAAVLRELHAVIARELSEGDDGELLRLLVGPAPEARA